MNRPLTDSDTYEDEEAGRPLRPITRHNRRLSDKVLAAFHQACDIGDLDTADALLRIVETLLTRPYNPAEGNRRRNMESLVAAHERLWHLRHPDPGV